MRMYIHTRIYIYIDICAHMEVCLCCCSKTEEICMGDPYSNLSDNKDPYLGILQPLEDNPRTHNMYIYRL